MMRNFLRGLGNFLLTGLVMLAFIATGFVWVPMALLIAAFQLFVLPFRGAILCVEKLLSRASSTKTEHPDLGELAGSTASSAHTAGSPSSR